MVKWICLTLYLLLKANSAFAGSYTLEVDNFLVFKIDPTSLVIVDKPKLIKIEKFPDHIKVFPKARKGLVTVNFLKNNRVDSHFIEIVPGENYSSKEKGRLVRGYLDFKKFYNRYEENGNYDYFTGEAEFFITKNSSLLVHYEKSSNQDQKALENFYAKLTVYDFFASYGNGSEVGKSFNSIPFNRGFYKVSELGYENSKRKVSLWYGTPQERYNLNNQTYFSDIKGFTFAERTLFNNNLELNLSFAQSDIHSIPAFGFDWKNFIFSGLTQSNYYSFLDNKHLLSSNTNYKANSKSKNLTFREFNYNQTLAPRGSYGMYGSFNNELNTINTFMNFSNIDTKEDDNIEYIPGVISFRPSYNYRLLGLSETSTYRLDNNYNFKKVSLALTGSLTESNLDNNLNTTTTLINPKLNVFFIGDMHDGWHIKNDNQFLESSNSFDHHRTSQRSTLGLFRNYHGLVAGGYLGSGSEENTGSAIAKSEIYGAEISYRSRGKRIGANVERRVFNLEGQGEQSNRNFLNLFANYQIARGHTLSARLRYNENFFNTGEIRVNTYGYVGYTWNFDIGSKDIVTTIKDNTRRITGRIFLDKNNNKIYDQGDEWLKDAEVSILKESPTTDITNFSGEFSFKEVQDKNYYLELKLPHGLTTYAEEIIVSSSSSVDIPVYSYQEEKIKIIDVTSKESISLPIETDCGELKFSRVVNQDGYLSVYGIKGCQNKVILKDLDQNLALVAKEKENGFTLWLVRPFKKQIIGSVKFENSKKLIKSNIYINNLKTVVDETGSFVIEITPYNGPMTIKYKGKDCKTIPKNPSFNNLKDTTQLEISCP